MSSVARLLLSVMALADFRSTMVYRTDKPARTGGCVMKNLQRKLAIALIGSACLIGHGTAQETKLLVTTMSPGGSGNSEKLFKPWVQRVNEAAGGAIALEARDGVTLANFTN